jgi:hypothetical protein
MKIKEGIFMHFQSHLLIGKVIHEFILDNYGVNLNPVLLIYGCIKPDISPKLINIPHYKEKSFSIISNRINALQKTTLPKNQKEMTSFSMELGIIIHYITDYFCYAHNNKDTNKLSEHFIYEINLHSDLRKYLSKEFNTGSIGLSLDDKDALETSLVEYIQLKHECYLKEIPKTYVDVRYALEVNCVLALSIITSAIIKGYPQVA